MKKVKNKKSYFDTSKWTSKESETTLFGANSKSKIVASVHCAYASKDKMVRIWPTLKKLIFYVISKVPYLHCKDKITKF
jgi:hypothetical protein